MTKLSYEQNKAFLDGFIQKYQYLESSKISETTEAFDNLFKGFRPLFDNFQRNIETFTPDYNIFEVLRIQHKEVFHSRFLADLLNINGAHKQGDLFYNLFLKQLFKINSNICKVLFEIDAENFWAFEIKCEYSITDKRLIDILIQYNDGSKQFAIGIENKIGAGDQKNQLEDYNVFLEENYGTNYLLLYLTIDAKEPSTDENRQSNGTYSIEFIKYNELIRNNRLLRVSHRNHIKTILEQTISQIQSPILKPILSNYYQILSTL